VGFDEVAEGETDASDFLSLNEERFTLRFSMTYDFSAMKKAHLRASRIWWGIS
jgi:hypothetical protein